MYSLPTHSSLQLPLKMQNNEDATHSPAMSTSSSRSATSQMRAFPHGGASSVRRKPSPLWPELEDRKANIEQVYLEAALPSAGLSIYTTESDAGPITPLTPNDLSHFPSTLTPKSGITHQYFLPVDHPLTGSQSPTSIPAVQTAAQSVQRSPPVIQARGSSISPINHTPPSSQFTDNTGSGHTHVNESQSNYQGHYLRAGASRQSSPASGSAARPTSIALQEQSRQLPVEQLSGLNITGAFGVEPHGGNMQRIESKVLPPIPLSRATTGVPGGPAPLPTSRATENAWKTHKPKKAKQEFSVEGLVDSMGMWDASHCYLKDELGRKRRFGEFFDPIDRADDPRHALSRLSSARSGSSRHTHVSRAAISKQKCGGEEWNVPGRKTVVFYIRHFWCGQSSQLLGQDFTFASLSQLDPEAIHAAGLNVVVISNGSWKIIKRYRELFKCAYPIYVDEDRHLYEKMGMVRLTNDFGPMFNGRAAYNQRSAPAQLVHGLKKAFVDLPLGNPGKLTQLGGEFVIGPGLECHFAHRMTNTSNHMEAFDVLQLAGCENPTTSEQRVRRFAEEELAQIEQLQQEEEEWRLGRTEELDRVSRSRAARRQHLTSSEATDSAPERPLSTAMEVTEEALSEVNPEISTRAI